MFVNSGVNNPNFTVKKQISGKTHSRAAELQAYRETIAIANQNMTNAIINGDYEVADIWSKTIDSTQEKIHEIINQEDGHQYQSTTSYSGVIKDVAESTGKIADTGAKIIRLFA